MPVKFEWTGERIVKLMDGLFEGKQQWKIAEELGCSVNLVERKIKEFRDNGTPLQTQRTGPRSGSGHPEWKGGRVVDKHGYILVYAPWHPNARKQGQGRGRYVAEHRLVMEQKLGRLLERGEVVHHLNGDNADNRPENLELFAKNSDHLRHELTGKCPRWSEEGKARIREAVRRRRGKRHPNTEPGAPVTPETPDHSTTGPEPSAPVPSKTE